MTEGFLTIDVNGAPEGASSVIQLEGCARWLALHRPGYYWNRPCVGTQLADVPPETQCLLWQRTDGMYGVLLPLIDGDLRACLRGVDGGIEICWEGGPGEVPQQARLAYLGWDDDPYALMEEAIDASARELRTFRPRSEKAAPVFADYLGWCTWDCFHQSIDEDKLVAGFQSLSAAGVQVGFLILDDGWMDTTGDYLNEFAVNADKFPHGLGPVVARVKGEFGLKLFGVWHAFMGYWAGPNPEGPLGKRYTLMHNRADIRPWEQGEQIIELHCPVAEEISRFYHEFHGWLRRQGVDMVKVDGQSSLELFTQGVAGRVSTMRAYQDALQGAVCAHCQGELLHCMSNGNDVAYHMDASTAWRNNDDNNPRGPLSKQQWHIWSNALNSLWSAQFALPDWDMFQSTQLCAGMHAAARAISGGPIYISDHPGEHSVELIKQLCMSDGRVLRYERPALPSRASLFADSHNEPVLLKVANEQCGIGALAVFHCCKDTADAIAGECSVADLVMPIEGPCAVYRYTTGDAQVCGEGDTVPVELNPGEFELLTFAPIENGIAVLGLVDKMAGPAAVLERTWQADGTLRIVLADGGVLGVYCVHGLRFQVPGSRFQEESGGGEGLMRVEVPKGGVVEVVIGKR